MDYSFLPNSLLARKLSTNYKSQLKDSYIDLLTQLATAGLDDFAKILIPKYQTLPPDNYNGLFSFYYHKSIELAEQSKFTEIYTILSMLLEPRHANTSGFVRNEDIADVIREPIFTRFYESIDEYEISMLPLDKEKEYEVFLELKRGIALLDIANPDLSSEIKELVNLYMFFDSGERCINKYKARSATSSATQGLILINGESSPDWIYLIDKWVHEAAHTYLFAINLKEEMILNDIDKIYASPLRKDKRHMFGVYHATFVIERLILAFSAIITRCALPPEEYQKIVKLLEYYHIGLEDGYNIIKQYGQLSNIAHNLINEGYNYCQALKAN